MSNDNIKKESIKKKLKRGGFSVLITAIVITSVVLLNVTVKLLLERFDVKIDMTENMLFSIENSTAEYIQNLNSEINFILTNKEEDFRASDTQIHYSQMHEVVRIFSQKSDKINIEYRELLKNPMLSSNYGGNLSSYNIIVESEKTKRYKVLTPEEYLDIKYFADDGSMISAQDAQMYSMFGMPVYQDISAAAEQAILSAIMSVSDETPIRVSFTSGYGENKEIYESFEELLQKNSYLTEELDLNLTDKIDSEIDILILFAPENDYSINTLREIDRWLDNNGSYGKTLIFVPGIQGAELKNTDAFLAEWGLHIPQSFIWQTDDRYAANSGLQQYLKTAPGEYSGGFESSRFFGVGVRPVEQLFESYSNIITTPLLETYHGATQIPFELLETIQDESEINSLPNGVFNAAAGSVKSRYDNGDSYESRLLVFGSPLLFDRDLLGAQQFSHAEYFINILNIISGKEASVAIAPKSFRLPALDIPGADIRNITIIFCFALPLAVLILGITVWLRRRKK